MFSCVHALIQKTPLLIFALWQNVLQLCHAKQGRGQQKCLVAIGTHRRTRQQRSIVWWKRDEGGEGVSPGMDRRWTTERERENEGVKAQLGVEWAETSQQSEKERTTAGTEK